MCVFIVILNSESIYCYNLKSCLSGEFSASLDNFSFQMLFVLKNNNINFSPLFYNIFVSCLLYI